MNNKLIVFCKQKKRDSLRSYEKTLRILPFLRNCKVIKSKRSMFFMIVGYSLIVIGFFPNGLFFLIPLGLVCLGVSRKDFEQMKRKIRYLIREGVIRRYLKDRWLLIKNKGGLKK